MTKKKKPPHINSGKRDLRGKGVAILLSGSALKPDCPLAVSASLALVFPSVKQW